MNTSKFSTQPKPRPEPTHVLLTRNGETYPVHRNWFDIAPAIDRYHRSAGPHTTFIVRVPRISEATK